MKFSTQMSIHLFQVNHHYSRWTDVFRADEIKGLGEKAETVLNLDDQ